MKHLILVFIAFVIGTLNFASAAELPKIIYLMADDQRVDTLGCMGNSIIQTPHIDAMAKQGVVFDS